MRAWPPIVLEGEDMSQLVTVAKFAPENPIPTKDTIELEWEHLWNELGCKPEHHGSVVNDGLVLIFDHDAQSRNIPPTLKLEGENLPTEIKGPILVFGHDQDRNLMVSISDADLSRLSWWAKTPEPQVTAAGERGEAGFPMSNWDEDVAAFMFASGHNLSPSDISSHISEVFNGYSGLVQATYQKACEFAHSIKDVDWSQGDDWYDRLDSAVEQWRRELFGLEREHTDTEIQR
jgi:hypothetical protein